MIRAWWNIRKNKIVHAYAVITILSLISHAHKSLQILYFFNYSIVCINYVGFIYPLSVRVKQHSQGGLMEHVELIKICLMNICLRKLTIKYHVGLIFDFSFAEIWHCITNAFLHKSELSTVATTEDDICAIPSPWKPVFSTVVYFLSSSLNMWEIDAVGFTLFLSIVWS